MRDGEFAALALAASRVATGILGWPPDLFWRATPAELAHAIAGRIGGPEGAAMPLRSADLARLIEEMPDGR